MVAQARAGLLFFYEVGARRDLHSFPTRRSSDLGITFEAPSPAAGQARLSFARRSCETQPRSEEHTSELQSHHDLVCRLLLEKKKRQVHLRHVLVPLA